jgi:hypothetical protein
MTDPLQAEPELTPARPFRDDKATAPIRARPGQTPSDAKFGLADGNRT